MGAPDYSSASLLAAMRKADNLSPSEKHVVEYIFENLELAAHLGIVELGEKTYTSTTTIKRLCKKLGIDSYTDFRIQLSAEISNYSRRNIYSAAKIPVVRYDTMNNIIRKVSDQNAKSIIDTSQLNDPDEVLKIVSLMREAKRIDFYGVGPSNVVAVDAKIKCMRLGIPSSSCADRVSMLINARAYQEGALAFFISYTGETDAVLQTAKELMDTPVTTVSLTSLSHNTLCEICDHKLYVEASESWDRLGGMSSRISTLNMIDILFTALINTDKDKYEQIMRSTNVSNRRGNTKD